MIRKHMRRNFKDNSQKRITTIKSSDLAFTPYTVRPRVVLKDKGASGEKEKKVQEPYPICTHCGKKILYISEAFVSKDGNGYVHFDCAKEIAEKELGSASGDKVAYVGKGKFAKVHVEKKPVDKSETPSYPRYGYQKERPYTYEFTYEKEYTSETHEQFEKFVSFVEALKK